VVVDAETTFIAPFDEVDAHHIPNNDGIDGEEDIIRMDSSNRGRPTDTVEILRRKSRNRCKEISLLQLQITTLQKMKVPWRKNVQARRECYVVWIPI